MESIKKELFDLKRVQQETLQKSVELMFKLGAYVQEEREQFKALGEGTKLEVYKSQLE